MRILTLLFTLALAFPAGADELRHFPGWKINKIEQAGNEEGAIASGPEYYGLTPPDERPPVSIDARTARALKSGEAQPEEVYGRVAGKGAKSEGAAVAGETYEYGAGNSGFVQADVISSTLPGYVAEPVAARNTARSMGDSFGAGQAASYGGSGASVSGGASEYAYNGSGEGSAAYGAPNGSFGPAGLSEALKGAAAAASPAAAQAEAKAKIKALAASSAGQDKLASSGLNVKSGFDPLETSEKESGKNPGKTGGVGGGRTPASDDEEVLPPCKKDRFVYDKPTLVRVKLPLGCKLILVSAWGAGGGTGMQIYQYGGGDNGPSESVQEIPGSGASFMSTAWDVDSKKYDLIVVVGDPGGTAKKKTVTVQDNSSDGGGGTRTITTLEGGDGGGPDGKDGSASGGGGGGGYSGVFLAAKGASGTSISKGQALVIGAGGHGGGSGGAGGSLNVPSSIPGARMSNQIGERGSGAKAGFHYYSERGNAGSPGNSGKVILEYY